MKLRNVAIVLALVFSANATAGDDVLGALADESGLSKRQVKMLVGARSGFAEYLASYDQTKRQFVHAIGKERYNALMAGKPVPVLQPDQRFASVTVQLPRR